MNSASMPALSDYRAEINRALLEFVKAENRNLEAIGSELIPVAQAIEKFLVESGKRLRPIFAYVGFVGSGKVPTPEILRAAASLELVHVCALIHDDVMDCSDTRRGAPSIHRAFEALHKSNQLLGSSEQFGISSAILLGDLALVWSAKMLHESGLDDRTLVRALKMYDEMRVELMAGQYLDVYEQALATQSVERSLKVARYKSAKYTIERPLHFGAALSSEDPTLLYKTYSEYGLPLGEAFQLRDDILGIFGDPKETGKPTGDDLREGKRTVLLAKTMELATVQERDLINRALGDSQLPEATVDQITKIIIGCGALEAVELLIQTLTNQALQAIENSNISNLAKSHLIELATLVTQRRV